MKGQTSTELILLIATMSIITLITAQYITESLNEITNHTKTVIKTGRDNILSKL
ncbi:MAG: hypothetical protein IJJ47_09035 [Methanosphaera sp.]|nr:hypothetical protein [Methanosphaera sp.]